MNPFTKIIVRIPQFPLNASIEDSWPDLLDAIRYASPEFYEQVKDLTFHQLEIQPAPVRRTIEKYFSRAKYRCTPLGKFASVGILETVAAAWHEVVVNNERQLYQFEDWRRIADMDKVSSDKNLQEGTKLFANSSYYQVGESIRYVKRTGETFELAEIGSLPIIVDILQYLSSPKTLVSVIKQIENSEDFIIPLMECGLIQNEMEPNLIGREYFKRIGYTGGNSTNKYMISELTFEKPCISKNLFRHIPALIQLLQSGASTNWENASLNNFAISFTKRFDRQNIRLMEALDPEIGVGYGDFHNNHLSDIIRSLTVEKEEEENAFALFLRKEVNAAQLCKPICLDDYDPEQAVNSRLKLPNSLSMICTVNDGQIYVDRIGGNSFNQLAGRFTLASESIHNLCKEISGMEEQANPGVVFFDMAYNAELNVDNVNRRKVIYSQELNLLNYPGSVEPLTLDDIYVSVSGSEIILRSKKLGKRLVPRMASAYNYRRSKLPVFRFLYDLSFYGLIPDLTFDLAEIVKGMKFYPKVKYRNIVLSQSKLRIVIEDLNADPKRTPQASLLELLANYSLGPLVRLLKGEEYTVYDLDDKFHVDSLIREIRKEGEVFLENFTLPEKPQFVDSKGRPYNNQLVIPLVHQKEIYGESTPIDPDLKVKRTYMPLEDWLYFEIFCAATVADGVLIELDHLVNRFEDEIKKWFFIRYNENGNHLRFRVLLSDQARLRFIDSLYHLLKPLTEPGLISDILIRSYNRELERYGVAGIENVETHFWLDSRRVMGFIKEHTSDLDKYCHCIRVFELVRTMNLIDATRYDKWTKHIHKILEEEHHLQVPQFKELGRYFQDRKHKIITLLNLVIDKEREFAYSMGAIIEACPKRRRAPMLSDLMHMHINRLFTDHQRTHEMIVYHILCQVNNRVKNVVKTQIQLPLTH